MQEIINQKRGLGPWLLSEETLAKIDSLMDKAYIDIVDWVKRTDKKYSNENYTKKLTIWFENGTKFEFQSFKEVSMSDNFSNQEPFKFEYIIEVGHNRVNIELNTDLLKHFQYNITCEDKSIENNIVYDMRNIYSAEKPEIISVIASMIGIFSFVFYFLLLLLLSNIYTLHYEIPNENAIKNKVYQILLKDSLQQEDYFEIIKYTSIQDFKLYRLIENDDSKRLSNRYDIIFLSYLVIGFVICIIITLSPKSSFAVGKGIKKVKRWKNYKRVYYNIIKLIFLPLIISIVSNIIFKKLF
jgi:hypothetical protein